MSKNDTRSSLAICLILTEKLLSRCSFVADPSDNTGSFESRIEINSKSSILQWNNLRTLQTPYRREQTEHKLFLILIFDGRTIRNSWASPLADTTRTNWELVLKRRLETKLEFHSSRLKKILSKNKINYSKPKYQNNGTNKVVDQRMVTSRKEKATK